MHLKIQNKSNNNFTTTVSTRAVLLPPPARPPSPRPAAVQPSHRLSAANAPPSIVRRSVWMRHPSVDRGRAFH